MALEQRLYQKQIQQLVMTPQLQQAIKLLQLSHLDLENIIAQELQENPALEETAAEEETEGEKVHEPESIRETTVTDKIADWQDYLDNYSNGRHDMGSTEAARDEDGYPSWENTVSRKDSLQDHLLWQLRMSGLNRYEEAIGVVIIGNLRENGYLGWSVEEICADTSAPPEDVERVLGYVQYFDPVGVGARDLRECLLIQLNSRGLGETLAARVVSDFLPLLEFKRYDKIAAQAGVSLDDVFGAARAITSLEPKPARNFGGEDVRTIVPDVTVEKISGEYVVLLNDDGVPPLRVSSLYRRLSQEQTAEVREAKDYLEEKVRAAAWLIKSIHWRQQTLYKVSQSIFRFQYDFLDHGVSHLRPLVLRDVAAEIEMHESTVSRATSNKYAHTPQGVFELKYFFQSGIPRSDSSADPFASEAVRDKIRNIVGSEDPKHPLSDQEITLALHNGGIDIARRTIAKYREQLGILPSSRRRQLFPNLR